MNKWMIALGIVVALLMVMFFSTKERTFVWDDESKFLHDDDEPFGCQLFDKMAEETFPNGYRYFDGDLKELLNSGERMALMMEFKNTGYMPYLFSKLDSFLVAGNKVMLIARNFEGNGIHSCSDFTSYYVSYFSKENLRDELTGEEPKARVLIGTQNKDTLEIPHPLMAYLSEIPEKAKVTSWGLEDKYFQNYLITDDVDVIDGRYPLSFSKKIKKGTLYVVSGTFLFTNYGVLDSQISRFLSYQMEQIADLPVVRVSAQSVKKFCMEIAGDEYVDYEGDDSSPLEHLLGYRPFRWALWTLLLAAILFMLFTARRRQRVIPLLSKPVNRNMEFVKLLGTIYYRRHDNHDLFVKKYTYFREELRRKEMIDLDDERMREGNARLLAQRVGVSEEEMLNTLTLFRAVAASEDNLGNEQLQDCVQKINEILKHI